MRSISAFPNWLTSLLLKALTSYTFSLHTLSLPDTIKIPSLFSLYMMNSRHLTTFFCCQCHFKRKFTHISFKMLQQWMTIELSLYISTCMASGSYNFLFLLLLLATPASSNVHAARGQIVHVHKSQSYATTLHSILFYCIQYRLTLWCH